MLAGMMFGEVVDAIRESVAPLYNELALADLVADPVKLHVHGFGSLLFDPVVGNARCSAVVGDHWGGQLGMV